MKLINNIKTSLLKILVKTNPTWEINRYYKFAFGKKANLQNPETLIEKIYWMQLHSDTSEWTLLADKYRVRDYIKEKGFEDYLPKLYGVWEDPEQIDIESLPMEFVIKANNGCKSVVIVKDKSKMDFLSLKKQMKEWIKSPFGYSGYEPHYLSIKPCIIAEELLIQDDYLQSISPDSMVDFKFWSFNGHVESCFVAYNRTENHLSVDLYDTQWNRLVDSLKNFKDDKVNPNINIPKPKCLNEMLGIASVLSKGHPQMRVDFYIVGGKPVIGELTMSSGYGYFTEEYYKHLGSLTDVNIIPLKR